VSVTDGDVELKFFKLRSDFPQKMLKHALRSFCTLYESFKLITFVAREE